MRVYRGRTLEDYQAGGSLTIREGVSASFKFLKPASKFPHYTWGCIALYSVFFFLGLVPSLYVRVYRPEADLTTGKWRSLTIREGVSPYQEHVSPIQWFPHYTWGCIGYLKRAIIGEEVPSLYVRVYRVSKKREIFSRCSLTIREGVSRVLSLAIYHQAFPHYTWGCIEVKLSHRRKS